MTNILIPNVGRRGYLVRYLKEIPDFKGKVFVSDCDRTASGLYSDNDGCFILSKPVEHEKKYISELLDLCKRETINIILPVIDPEIFLLSKYRDIFREKGIFVVVSDRRVLDICYNKLLMKDFLEKNGFETPATFCAIADFEKAYRQRTMDFPVIIKPVYGSGSQETYVVNTLDKLKALFNEKMLIQEYIKGQEYGVDVFNTLDKQPVRCVVKKKISMRSGETDKAVTIKDSTIRDCMIQLGKALGHIGNLDSDIISKDGKIYIIDLNPRLGGGYPATHASGVNLLSLILALYENKDISPAFDDYEENLLVMKEIDTVMLRNYS